MRFKDTLKKGTVEMLILYLLQEEDLYGYQITQALSEKSGGTYNVLAGSLYPILYDLEEAGHITEYTQQAGKRRIRKYYHIEDSGKEYFNSIYKDYLSMLESIDRIMDKK